MLVYIADLTNTIVLYKTSHPNASLLVLPNVGLSEEGCYCMVICNSLRNLEHYWSDSITCQDHLLLHKCFRIIILTSIIIYTSQGNFVKSARYVVLYK